MQSLSVPHKGIQKSLCQRTQNLFSRAAGTAELSWAHANQPKAPGESWLRSRPRCGGPGALRGTTRCLWWHRCQHPSLGSAACAAPHTSAGSPAHLPQAICSNLIWPALPCCPSLNPRNKSFRITE